MLGNLFVLIFLIVVKFAHTGLYEDCQQGNWKQVQGTLASMPNPAQIRASTLKQCLDRAFCAGQPSLLEYFLSLNQKNINYLSEKCFYKAIELGYSKTMQVALNHHLNIERLCKNETPFHIAVRNSNHETFINIFLAHAMENNILNNNGISLIDKRSSLTGMTALGEAISGNHYNAAKALSVAGASLVDAVLIKHKNSFPSLLKPKKKHAKFINEWLANNDVESLRAFFLDLRISSFHKKGVYKFLSAGSKHEVLDEIWEEHGNAKIAELSDRISKLKTQNSKNFFSFLHKIDEKTLPDSPEKEYVCLSICSAESEEKTHVNCGDCHHKICRECLDGYVEFLSSNPHESLICPAKNCSAEIMFDDLTNINQEKRNQLRINNQKKKMETNPNFMHCHQPDCRGGSCDFIKFSLMDKSHIECNICGEIQCIECGYFHPKKTCADVGDIISEEAIKKMTEKGKVKPCPGCKFQIEKTGGCNHMTCKHCKYQFYWDTLKKYKKQT